MLAKNKYYSWGGELVKSSYGLLLGCRSGLDFGPSEKTFFDKVRTQKPGKSSALSVLVHGLNRSGVVELVEREPLIIAGVENGVIKLSPKRQKTPKFSKNKMDRENSFQWGIFIFLAAEKPTFGGEGYNFKTG